MAVVTIVLGIVGVLLIGVGQMVTMPIMYDLYNSPQVQNLTGQARIAADNIYNVFNMSGLLFLGAAFLNMFMQATRRQSDELFG